MWDPVTNTTIPKITFKAETGLTCALWLISYCDKNNKEIPSYNTHTSYIEGSTIIRKTLNSYIAHARNNSKIPKILALYSNAMKN